MSPKINKTKSIYYNYYDYSSIYICVCVNCYPYRVL